MIKKDDVLNKLEEKLKRDPKLKALGAKSHGYRLNEPLSPEVLQKFEAHFSVQLPRDYAEFLLTISNGGAGPGYGLFTLEKSVKYIEPVYDDNDNAIIKAVEVLRHEFIPPGYSGDFRDDEETGALRICEHGCANDDFLILTGPEAGTVWTWVEWTGFLPIQEKDTLPDYTGCVTTEDRMAANRKWANEMLSEANKSRIDFTAWYVKWLESPPRVI